MTRSELPKAIERLEGALSSTGVREELAAVRRGLTDGLVRKPAVGLPNLRLGFACKQRWEDMVGDDQVRACGGCDRPVFNLSAMSRDEAERVLATRGLTPCVRFYRRPDGTVMTTDCPTNISTSRRLALAGSLAAGTVLAVAPSAHAEPSPVVEVATNTTDMHDDAPPKDESSPVMGIADLEPEMGVIVVQVPERAPIEWSVWGRIGFGVATQHSNVLARQLTAPELQTATMWEAAIGVDLTVGIAHGGNIRLGGWSELRTSSGPVVGGELVIAGLPPHPYDSRIAGTGSVVLRVGANSHVLTSAIGVGYGGSFPVSDPWISWARHVVGGRIVATMNRSLDDPRDWSATLGLELEPIGVLRAVLDLATGD